MNHVLYEFLKNLKGNLSCVHCSVVLLNTNKDNITPWDLQKDHEKIRSVYWAIVSILSLYNIAYPTVGFIYIQGSRRDIRDRLQALAKSGSARGSGSSNQGTSKLVSLTSSNNRSNRHEYVKKEKNPCEWHKFCNNSFKIYLTRKFS